MAARAAHSPERFAAGRRGLLDRLSGRHRPFGLGPHRGVLHYGLRATFFFAGLPKPALYAAGARDTLEPATVLGNRLFRRAASRSGVASATSAHVSSDVATRLGMAARLWTSP